ncbi:hypothetical protein J4219_03045 [Candidatus Woesearchaeota archaeon]|nr:hypothetical protein [Candidatus Woesearchaeota archaeon]
MSDDLQERVRSAFEERYCKKDMIQTERSKIIGFFSFSLQLFYQDAKAAYDPERFLDEIIEGVLADKSERGRARSYAAEFFHDNRLKGSKRAILLNLAYSGVVISWSGYWVSKNWGARAFERIYEGNIDIDAKLALLMLNFGIGCILLGTQSMKLCSHIATHRLKSYLGDTNG